MGGKRKAEDNGEVADKKPKLDASGRFWINKYLSKDEHDHVVIKEFPMDHRTRDASAYPAVICFYSESKAEMPGYGTGEDIGSIDADTQQMYRYLGELRFTMPGVLTRQPKEGSKIETFQVGFRQMMSNFCRCCDFEYEGRVYRTVEHAFHATKFFKCADMYPGATSESWKAYGERFTKQGDILTPFQSKSMGGKTATKQLKMPKIFFDEHWGAGFNYTCMAEIQHAKLTACLANSTCGRSALVVLLTHRAALMHSQNRRADKIHFVGLETWRDNVWESGKAPELIENLKLIMNVNERDHPITL
jgi:hypothetical protein